MKVAVVGAGSWGTALAQVLADAGNTVSLWARKGEVAEGINRDHKNIRYLSHATLPSQISGTSSLEECLDEAEAVVVVTPSSTLREFAQKMKPLLEENTPLIVCSKGVEEDTGYLPVEIFGDVIGNPDRLAVLSGPNHAEEVIARIPSGTVIASRSEQTAVRFRNLFSTPYFRGYTSDDYVGVELCAAFKNVIAIGVGISYGIGFGDNTAAMLMTRGMAEMSRLVEARGGQAMTVMGLAGAGDLIATCTSEHSRNRSFGKQLAQGTSLEEFCEKTHMVVEGALACKTISPLAERCGVELPITEMVKSVVWENASIARAAQALISRPLTTEFWGIAQSK